LKPGGISIPCSYTSFLAPITSCKMMEAVRAYKVGVGVFGGGEERGWKGEVGRGKDCMLE